MVERRRKPETPEEAIADIEAHPERGKVEGEDLIAFDKIELRQAVPRELWQRALEVGGAMGLNKTDLVTAALVEWVSDPGRQQMLSNFYSLKLSKHQTSNRFEIFTKVLGAYKNLARKLRANLDTTTQK